MSNLSLCISTALLSAVLSTSVLAATEVLEGESGAALFGEKATGSFTLRQKDKVFSIVKPDGSEDAEGTEFTVGTREHFFITNEEERTTHNVYDQSDSNWVLKKQKPGGTAAIAFQEPGVHELRCAIHPKMKMTVVVEDQ